jgi:hypothetical protein
MGMYTRLVLNIAIPEKATIIPALHAMVAGRDENPDPAITGRLCWMFNSSSYYHQNIQQVSFKHDDISKEWKLSVTCDIKNYENEIETLANWLAPHIKEEALAGYSRYEEDENGCDLLWFRGGKAVWARGVI